MAVISLDFSSVACCPSTIRCRAAQAELRCNGLRPLRLSWLVRREGLAVDGDDVGVIVAQPGSRP